MSPHTHTSRLPPLFLLLLLLLISPALSIPLSSRQQQPVPISIPDTQPDETLTPIGEPVSPPPPPPPPAPTPSPVPSVVPPPANAPVVVAADNLSGRGSAVGIVAAIIAALFVVLVAVISMVCISDRFARSDPDTGWDAAAGVYTTDAAVATDAPGAQADAGASGGSGECVGVDDGVGYMDEDATRHMDVTDVKDDDVVVSVVAPTPDALVRGATPPPHDYVLGAGPAATRSDFVDLRGRFERDEIGDNSAVLGVERVAGVAADADGAGLPDRGDVGVNGVTFDSQERLMKGGDGSGVVSDAALSVNAASIAEESGDVPSLERDPIDDRAARARNRDGF